MKKYLISILIIFISFHVSAQISLEKTLLWQITGPGITKPSYLYGTIHLICPDDIIVTDSLRADFYRTQQLFLEINMDDPSVLTKTMQGMKMKNDTTLQQLLSTSQYDSVALQFKQITGTPIDLVSNMKPELLESVIYPSMLGCEGEAWEQKFMQLAKANNMKVNGLEEVEDQIKIFDEIPYKTQADEFAQTILHIDSVKESFTQMLNMYKQKDLNGLNKLMDDEDDFSGYEDILLKNRNEKWIPEIIEQATLMPTFFAVGAAHLGNENGVINLLRKRGYTVKPIFY